MRHRLWANPAIVNDMTSMSTSGQLGSGARDIDWARARRAIEGEPRALNYPGNTLFSPLFTPRMGYKTLDSLCFLKSFFNKKA